MKKIHLLIRSLLVLITALATNHAQAVSITYDYTGQNFTSGTGQPGFSTSDRLTASFTLAAPLAANAISFSLATATMRSISNGVFSTDFTGSVDTDGFGNITQWTLTGLPTLQPDLSTVQLFANNNAIEVQDLAFRVLSDLSQQNAFGPHGVHGTWTSGPANSVPDHGATLTLCGLALVPLLGALRGASRAATSRQ